MVERPITVTRLRVRIPLFIRYNSIDLQVTKSAHGVYSSVVERSVVVREVAGSNPVTHPISNGSSDAFTAIQSGTSIRKKEPCRIALMDYLRGKQRLLSRQASSKITIMMMVKQLNRTLLMIPSKMGSTERRQPKKTVRLH